MIVTTSWMATEVTQPLVQYLPKVLASVIDVTKIHLMWRRDTHEPSVRLPGFVRSHKKKIKLSLCGAWYSLQLTGGPL